MDEKGSGGSAPSVVALFLALSLAGCIFTSSHDDVSIVCERRAGSPSHPYSPDDVKRMTLIEPGATVAGVDDATAVAADHVVTLAGAPYAGFEGHLFPTGEGGWRFDANGTASDGPADRYQLGFAEANGTLVPLAAHPIFAPARLAEHAAEVARDDPEANALVANATLERATWDAGAPSCVRLEHAGGLVVTVNVVEGRVVHVLR